jgi:NifU-like protein involved in Fe-S cluster formation
MTRKNEVNACGACAEEDALDGVNWTYGKEVKKHFFKPKNILFDEFGYKYDGMSSVISQNCGDSMKLWIKVNKKNGRIKECKWRSFGCAASIATASMMSVMVTEKGGMTIKQAQAMKPDEIVDRLGGLPEKKHHCSHLCHEALQKAVLDYLQKIC